MEEGAGEDVDDEVECKGRMGRWWREATWAGRSGEVADGGGGHVLWVERVKGSTLAKKNRTWTLRGGRFSRTRQGGYASRELAKA